MITNLLKLLVVGTLLFVSFVCLSYLANESIKYNYKWVTHLRSPDGKLTEVNLEPIGFDGEKVLFNDSIGNTIEYLGDFISTKLEAQIIPQNKIGEIINNNAPRVLTKTLIAPQINDFNKVKNSQAELNKLMSRLSCIEREIADIKRGNDAPTTFEINRLIQQEKEAGNNITYQTAYSELKRRESGNSNKILKLEAEMRDLNSRILEIKQK